MIRRLASLHWLQLGAVRQLRRYYQDAMTSCRSSRRAPLPSLGGTSVSLVAFAPRRTSAPPRPGVGNPVSPAGNAAEEASRSSQVPGEPQVSVCTCSNPTPAGLLAPDHYGAAAWPLVIQNKGSHEGLSKLNSMAFGLAVYASQTGYPATTQDSLPAAGQALPDGLSTRKVPTKGFKVASLHLILLSQALLGTRKSPAHYQFSVATTILG